MKDLQETIKQLQIENEVLKKALIYQENKVKTLEKYKANADESNMKLNNMLISIENVFIDNRKTGH